MSLPKPAERRQRTRKATVTAWQRLWNSPQAHTINVDSDLPAIERLFVLRDERARAFRGAKRARIVNFDGDTARHFLRDLCVYAMDVAPDGSLWLQAGRLPPQWLLEEEEPTIPVHAYVITPEALAAIA